VWLWCGSFPFSVWPYFLPVTFLHLGPNTGLLMLVGFKG
jgi:hypothetical protein